MKSRFAPSPTGPLHAGSLVAALGSWLDARAHNASWLVRIEDIDIERNIPGADQDILKTLAACGLEWDETPIWQSARLASYQEALETLKAKGQAYACICSRKVLSEQPSLIYPGTCRHRLSSSEHRHAWRFALPNRYQAVTFTDRRLGKQSEVTQETVGDFVIKRADGNWAYQLAVVVDDEAFGITDVVRGEDLLDSSARQIHLQQALGYRTPRYLHLPLVLADNGEKLSKQTLATGLDTSTALTANTAILSAANALFLITEGLQAEMQQRELLEALIKTWPY